MTCNLPLLAAVGSPLLNLYTHRRYVMLTRQHITGNIIKQHTYILDIQSPVDCSTKFSTAESNTQTVSCVNMAVHHW